LNASIFCLRFTTIGLGHGSSKLLCLFFVASLQLYNSQTQACKLWQQQLCALVFCLKFAPFKLRLVAIARLLCTCFLLWVKGWACGNNKLMHLLGLVATTSFSIYLGLVQQQVSTITFYCGLKVCSIQT